MKVCIGVVLYHPTEKEINRIIDYLNVFYDVYIYDNTPEKSCEKYFKGLGFHYYFNNNNDGMAIALNYICKSAIHDDNDFIITMDQDSIISNEGLEDMKKYIIENDMEDIGVVAPTIIYNEVHEKKKSEGKIEAIEWTITSGSAINLNVYCKTEGFDENYFIDRLDFDYCVMLKEKKKKIIRLSWIYLYQKLGDEIGNKCEHNSLRNYYMFRNRLYFYNKYKKGLIKYIILFITITRHISRIIFFEANKVEKLKMFNKALYDYHHNNMGVIKL